MLPHVRKACGPCISLKIKCDHNRPCGQCVHRDAESKCMDVSRKPRQKRPRPTTPQSISETQLQQIQVLARMLHENPLHPLQLLQLNIQQLELIKGQQEQTQQQAQQTQELQLSSKSKLQQEIQNYKTLPPPISEYTSESSSQPFDMLNAFLEPLAEEKPQRIQSLDQLIPQSLDQVQQISLQAQQTHEQVPQVPYSQAQQMSAINFGSSQQYSSQQYSSQQASSQQASSQQDSQTPFDFTFQQASPLQTSPLQTFSLQSSIQDQSQQTSSQPISPYSPQFLHQQSQPPSPQHSPPQLSSSPPQLASSPQQASPPQLVPSALFSHPISPPISPPVDDMQDATLLPQHTISEHNSLDSEDTRHCIDEANIETSGFPSNSNSLPAFVYGMLSLIQTDNSDTTQLMKQLQQIKAYLDKYLLKVQFSSPIPREISISKGVAIVNPRKFMFLDCNESFAGNLGYSSSYLAGKGIGILALPFYVKVIRRDISYYLKNNITIGQRYVGLRHANGGVMYCMAYFQLVAREHALMTLLYAYDDIPLCLKIAFHHYLGLNSVYAPSFHHDCALPYCHCKMLHLPIPPEVEMEL